MIVLSIANTQMQVKFLRGKPPPNFMMRLRALCDEHDVGLVPPSSAEKEPHNRYKTNTLVRALFSLSL